MTETRRFSVLFVCMGNICRSPTGEGVFRHFADAAGLGPSLHIDSAGTIAYHSGEPADARMQAAARRRGYRLDSIARQVVPADIDRFDLILAMDADNLRGLEQLAGGQRPHLLKFGHFVPGARAPALTPDVPDPYYGGPEGFNSVIDLIESGCPRLVDYCRARIRERE